MDLTDASAVADAIASLRSAGRTATIVGGGTLLDVGDGAPSDDRIVTTSLRGVLAYDPADLTITCRAGTTLAELQATLAERGQMLPVWHPAPDVATIGGLVAFGWTGLGRVTFGPLRHRVLEVHAVTGASTVIRGGGKVVKNVTGFDLPRLFHGSMGTLGVITEVTLKVQPRGTPIRGVTTYVDDPSGAIVRLRATLDEVRMPVEALLVRDGDGWRSAVFSSDPALLEPFRGAPLDGDAFDALATSWSTIGGLDGDVAVRVSVPRAALDVGRTAEALIDVATGTAWLGVSADEARRLRTWAESLGGSMVVLRATEDVRRDLGTWGAPPAGIEIMGRLRRSFDPDGVLNRGRFVV